MLLNCIIFLTGIALIQLRVGLPAFLVKPRELTIWFVWIKRDKNKDVIQKELK